MRDSSRITEGGPVGYPRSPTGVSGHGRTAHIAGFLPVCWPRAAAGNIEVAALVEPD
ncbi:MAG: hypothetical protein M3460_08790 [Actinomycetota bacterium]|nr:hypothetical protein [Actinomycetota bacterium]